MGRAARAAAGERETGAQGHRRERAPRAAASGPGPGHAATATPPRRGSPAPDSAPVAGFRSTA